MRVWSACWARGPRRPYPSSLCQRRYLGQAAEEAVKEARLLGRGGEVRQSQEGAHQAQ